MNVFADDDDLAEFLGISKEPKCAAIIAAIKPEQMATYEAMKVACQDIEIWQNGGPRPTGIIICEEHKRKRNHDH